MREEERARQAECARLSMQIEEIRAALRGEAEERRLDTSPSGSVAAPSTRLSSQAWSTRSKSSPP